MEELLNEQGISRNQESLICLYEDSFRLIYADILCNEKIAILPKESAKETDRRV